MLHNVGSSVASGGSPSSTDNFDADADVAASKVGELVNARIAAVSTGTSDWVRLRSSAVATAHAYTTARLMTDAVLRADDGATFSAVGSRGSAGAEVATIQRLLTSSLARVYNPSSGDFHSVVGDRELSTNNVDALGCLQIRASGYQSSRRGRRYRAGTLDLTGVASRTTLLLTEPAFLIVAGATNELIIRRITISNPIVSTATSFRALVKTDTANRYSSGGTTRTPETLNPANAVASGVAQSRESTGGAVIVATAEGGGTRGAGAKSGNTLNGAVIEFLYKDGLIIPAGGSLLVYIVTATTSDDVDVDIEFEEANV